MQFVEGLNIYFTRILDPTTYIAYFLISFGLCFICAPKPFEKKAFRYLIPMFIGAYLSCVAVSALFFGISNAMPNTIPSKMMIFTLAIPLVVSVFLIIVLKGYKLHRFIKIFTLATIVLMCDAISKNIGFLVGQMTSQMPLVVLARVTPFIIFPIFCVLLHQIDINHYRNLSKEMVIIVSILDITLVLLGLQEHYETVQDKEINLLLSLLDVVLMFLIGFSYYTTFKNIKNRHHITNLEVQKTLEDADKITIEIDKANREELAKIRHDIKNQFSYLNVLIQQGKYDEASKFIEGFLERKEEVLYSFSCSNDVINSIINLELTKAKLKGIKVDAKAVVPPSLPFHSVDLVSLLTNMIDNAIENYYSESNEQILVRIMKQNDFIRIIVSNPVNIEKINPNGITITQKLGRGHGYGTKIIKNVVKTYNGGVDFNVEGNRFICDVILNLNIEGK